jgi:twitching motility protein PilJ
MNAQLELIKNQFKNKANILIVIMAALVVLAAINFVLLGAQSAKNAKYASHTSELRVLAQGIAKNANQAAEGNLNAFADLSAGKKGFSERFNKLKNGDGSSSVFTANDLASLQKVWLAVEANVEVIEENEDAIIEFKEAADAFSNSVPAIQRSYDEIVDSLIATGASSFQVSEAQKQIWRAERIASGAANILSGNSDSMKVVDQLGKDIAKFARVNEGFLKGDSGIDIARTADAKARAELAKVSKTFSGLKENLDIALESSEQLFGVGNAASEIFASSQKLLNESTSLNTNLVTKTGASFFPSTIFGGGAFFLAFICGVVYAFLTLKDASKKRVYVEQENVHNQEAIMRLLDELGDLADGDLTVQATVTEDFTGAIADSINYSIDQMRELVSSINQSAVEVSSAAQETQATAMHLAEASEHQAQEIAGASAAVNEMAVSIDQVSANAAESSQVAQRSVEIANKGSEVVQNTIKGMDTIREQIQDTSKRIKRLGESSQEIGDIVSLINDIADQTNILALNAAIQASMAGDAGRGFAVVADEVQRLAERSAGATKQIEALVKTIQTDTNEAVISMENTTTEVVKGARLAEDAGVSLEEIESVSTNLADLIQNISNAARQQAASAGHISNTMNVIQEITSQTSAGTSATAKSIGNLAELAAGMRSSVAGFKLPDQL